MKMIWLFIAIIFAVAEMTTVTLTLVWFSISAIIMIFLSSIIENIVVQIVIYGILSTSMLVIATKKFVKEDENYKYDTNLQAILNEKAIVKEDIPNIGTGLVVVRGEEWSAVSLNNEYIEKDEYVRVVKIEGVKLIVEKYK